MVGRREIVVFCAPSTVFADGTGSYGVGPVGEFFCGTERVREETRSARILRGKEEEEERPRPPRANASGV
jgi:hypothetical protein